MQDICSLHAAEVGQHRPDQRVLGNESFAILHGPDAACLRLDLVDKQLVPDFEGPVLGGVVSRQGFGKFPVRLDHRRAFASAVFGVRVSTVENAVTREELEDDYGLTPKTLSDAMQSSAKGWVCGVDGKIAGFAMGDRDSGELTVIAVLPGFEHRGIGRALLGKVTDWLFACGHDVLWLLTTPDPELRAYDFYLSQGWVASGAIVEDEEDEKFTLKKP